MQGTEGGIRVEITRESRATFVNHADFRLQLGENAVVRFRVAPVSGTSNFGYDYGWYVEHR